ncbi:prepilin-type N-terminal cleavage/methylation domain-containing protein [bacterium]|nr:prepilin-type N-terminal cleavage/methylation domain-containing protein [bacterium]
MVSLRKKGFTLIELLVVIAIIAILAAILFPVLTNVKEKGRATTCTSNLRQLTMAIFQYCDDNSGIMPPVHPGGHFSRDWAGCVGINGVDVRQAPIWKWIRNEKVFACPSGKKPLSYAMNMFMGTYDVKGDIRYNLKLETECAGRARNVMLLIHDGNHDDGYFAIDNSTNIPDNIHLGGTCLSYCDGHVKCAPKAALKAECDKGDWYSQAWWDYLRKG